MQSYHITKDGDQWKLAREGAARASLTADTKQEIIHATQRYMKNREGSVKIHKLDGKIQEERTYLRKGESRPKSGTRRKGETRRRKH